MREANRHEHLRPFRRRQLGPNPVPEGGRTRADVDNDIVNPSPRAQHELGLAMWRDLKMKPSERKGGHGQRVIVLHESTRYATSFESSLRIDFGKPSTGIGMPLGGDKLYWRGHAAPLASLPD